MKTINHALRKGFEEVVTYEIEDFYNAEDYEYEPLYKDRAELAEEVWKTFVKYNPEGVRFMGKEAALAIIREWIGEEDEEDIRAIVKNY